MVANMEEQIARQLLVDTGKELLKSKLVARTWGNVSCRLDGEKYMITPSGLDYTRTHVDDIVRMELTTGAWHGKRKPSGERGIHSAAFLTYPEVNFVIHTHQIYATAIGLAGFEQLSITQEEKEQLGGIAIAGYGLPGTEKLALEVKKALESGAQTILMVHHGVLVCGCDQKEAMSKALLLEKICKRNVQGQPQKDVPSINEESKNVLQAKMERRYPHVGFVCTPVVMVCAESGRAIRAQVDDMSQMIGGKIPVVSQDSAKIIKALEKKTAVLVKGVGAVVNADSQDDVVALELLVEKAAVCSLHAAAMGEKATISMLDNAAMRWVYVQKYSKQKEV